MVDKHGIPLGEGMYIIDSGCYLNGDPGFIVDIDPTGAWFANRAGSTFLTEKELALWIEVDRTHPATLGCLRELVREAWGDSTITVYPWNKIGDRFEWYLDCLDLNRTPLPGGEWETEGDALIAALKAAGVSDETIKEVSIENK